MAAEEMGKLANPRLMFWFALAFVVTQAVSITLPLVLEPPIQASALEEQAAALESRRETIGLAFYAIPGLVFFGIYLLWRNPLLFFGGLYMTAVAVALEALKSLALLL